MAQEFDDLGFWLPSEFLTEDELLTDFKTDHLKNRGIYDFACGFGNSFGLCSDLSSPTKETESDEDELISYLTRKLAYSTFSSDYSNKGMKLYGSPQSTLCGCKPGSRGSPNSVSGVCSPPDAEDHLRWDLLYAAAEKATRMRMIEESTALYSAKLYPPQVKPIPVTAHQQNPNPASTYYPHQAQAQNHISFQQLATAKFQQMKQHEMMKNIVHMQGVTEYQLQNRRSGVEARTQGSSMANWPNLPQIKQQPSSGMRAVFLGETGMKKERTGTGVFLPKRFDSVPCDTHKKPSGCSTVFLPEKVVHALTFNREPIDAQIHNRVSGSINRDFDASLKHRNNLMRAQQSRGLVVPQPVMNQQLSLPQEWTY